MFRSSSANVFSGTDHLVAPHGFEAVHSDSFYRTGIIIGDFPAIRPCLDKDPACVILRSI